jgi:hypothetical protein
VKTKVSLLKNDLKLFLGRVLPWAFPVIIGVWATAVAMDSFSQHQYQLFFGIHMTAALLLFSSWHPLRGDQSRLNELVTMYLAFSIVYSIMVTGLAAMLMPVGFLIASLLMLGEVTIVCYILETNNGHQC